MSLQKMSLQCQCWDQALCFGKELFIYMCICTYLWRALFQNMISELGIGIATLARCEVVLHGCETSLVCLVYALATVFQSCHGGDMRYEMRRRKPKPTGLLTQWIFNLPFHIGMVWEELSFDDPVSYTKWGHGLQHSKCYGSEWDSWPVPHDHLASTLTN